MSSDAGGVTCSFCGAPAAEELAQDVGVCDGCRPHVDGFRDAVGDDLDPPSYRGTVALGVPLAGWPAEARLLTADVWDRVAQVSMILRDGRHTFPRGVVVRTDAGTVHHSGGGGGGTRGSGRFTDWHAVVVPTLPDAATRIDVTAVSPGAEGHATAVLDGWPATPVPGPVTVGPPEIGSPDCPACGRPPPPPEPPATTIALDWAIPVPPEPPPQPPRDERPLCRACRARMDAVHAAQGRAGAAPPDRAVPVSTTWGDLFGSTLVATSLLAWPTWFDLTIAGASTGAWSELVMAPRMTARWAARDDRGRDYVGTMSGGSGGFGLASLDLSFAPALDPAATELTVTFPPSIDGTTTRATLPVPG